MKKIIIAMAAIAAAFTMASCNKEQPVSPNENSTVGKSVITASIDNDLTKATLNPVTNGYEVRWSEGDDIFVADFEFSCWAAKYTLDSSSAGSSTGVFSWHTGDMFIPATEEYEDGPVFEKGDYYIAMYPFDLVGEEISPMWKTEQTYDETERYIPMYSELEGTEDGTADFTFRNLGGMLRLTVTGSATIRSIKISAAEGEAMSGPFSLMLDYDDFTLAVMEGGANYIILDCGEEGVALTEDGTDFYFSIPCRCICDEYDIVVGLDGYSDVAITLTDMEGRTCEKKLKNEDGLVIERSKMATASFAANEFKANVSAGKFSVSEDKQVYFSQGNLYGIDNGAEAAQRYTFAFEDNQHEYHTYTSGSNTWGFLGWSTSADDNHYGMSTSTVNSVYSGDFVDWGTAIDDNKTWRTLTIKEWEYLFSNHSKKWVTVNGVNGYVIAPDGVTLSEVATSYSEDELKQDYLVFLPAAGYRYTFGQYPSVYNANESGFYWSSTADGQNSANAYYMEFYDEKVSFDNIGVRSFGYSVRLVTDCE